MTDEQKQDEIIEEQPAEEIKDEVVEEKTKKGFFSKECKGCEKHKAEAVEAKMGWHRALADYQNLQKETASRRAELVMMSELQILEEFIPVYDNFKKAFAQKPVLSGEVEAKQIENWINGIGFIKQYFAGVLKSHKVDEIETVGKMLDTKFHEAVGEEESDQPHGTILKEVEGGYIMGERVVKVARVIIAK